MEYSLHLYFNIFECLFDIVDVIYRLAVLINAQDKLFSQVNITLDYGSAAKAFIRSKSYRIEKIKRGIVLIQLIKCVITSVHDEASLSKIPVAYV